MRHNYVSRLHAALCFDELTRTYLNFTSNLRKNYPPVTGTILPANMPDFRGPVTGSPPPADTFALISLGILNGPPAVDPSIAPILTSINLNLSGGHHFNFHVYPILVGHLTPSERKTCAHVDLSNHDISTLVGA